MDIHILTFRIKELRTRQHAHDLLSLLKEADLTERKAFLRSLIKRIEINRNEVVVHYYLPLPQNEKGKRVPEVLPIVTLGGPYGTVPELLFEKKGLVKELQKLLVSK